QRMRNCVLGVTGFSECGVPAGSHTGDILACALQMSSTVPLFRLSSIYTFGWNTRGGDGMARTPLLTTFQQLYRDFEAAEACGKSAVQNDSRGSALSRRDFVKFSGAVAATIMLGQHGESLATRQPRIVIVGGGIAGL